MGLGQILAVSTFAFEEVGNSVEAEAIDAEIGPEAQHIEHRFLHRRIVIVQIRLVGEEAVPVVLATHRVIGPVGILGIDKDNACARVSVRVISPDIKAAVGAIRISARLLKPLMGIGGVVHHQVSNNADTARMGLVEKHLKILDRAKLVEHGAEVADIVTAVAQRGVVERRQPEAVNAQPLQIIELLRQPFEVAGAVVVGVEEGPDEHLIEHRAAVPLVIFLGDSHASQRNDYATSLQREFSCEIPQDRARRPSWETSLNSILNNLVFLNQRGELVRIIQLQLRCHRSDRSRHHVDSHVCHSRRFLQRRNNQCMSLNTLPGNDEPRMPEPALCH